MSQSQTRKRPAPGTSPLASNVQQATHPALQGISNPSQLSNDQFLSWGVQDNNNNNNDYLSTTSAANATQSYPIAAAAPFADQTSQSNQLVRRNLNQQLATRPVRQPGQPHPNQDPWTEHEMATSSGLGGKEEDEAEIDARAAAAQRDALSKRVPKQIPPFIQKLSSFLEKDYTDLIRWSDDGNSFIVVDEDRFAQKLIPELFKHNNYASFVRQLNMYGFHKIVGLSDNSMRASEKKAKTPREYQHKYFKRGRPDLLWLIEKPPNKNSKPKSKPAKATDNHDEADDDHDEMAEAGPDEADDAKQGNTDLTTIPKADLASLKSLRKEVESLQKSQQQIYSILARMRDENNQYIRQAGAMVANHERHESSINAILTFLATFYNQTLQGHEATGNMFAHAVPNNQPQGSVVDVGDVTDSPSYNSPQFPPRRPPLALMAPPTAADSPTTEPSPASSRPRTRSFSSNPSGWAQSRNFRPGSTASQVSPVQSPDQSNNRTIPQLAKDNNEILNVINRSNANVPQDNSHGPKLDFNSALQHYQNSNGKAPLTPEQRNAMLSIMANNSGTSTPTVKDGNNDPAPFLDYFNANHDHLEMIQRLQEEQDSKVQDLADRLQPLSPSGSIPGLDLSQAGSNPNFNFNNPYGDNFDIDNFLEDDYLAAPNTDFDFSQFASDNNNNNNSQARNDVGVTPSDPANNENTNDASLFGDDNDELAPSPGDDDDDADNDGGGRGRIVGSVSSSSGRPTPSVEDAEENYENDSMRSPNKKRRTAR